jgi:hypothetical protein
MEVSHVWCVCGVCGVICESRCVVYLMCNLYTIYNGSIRKNVSAVGNIIIKLDPPAQPGLLVPVRHITVSYITRRINTATVTDTAHNIPNGILTHTDSYLFLSSTSVGKNTWLSENNGSTATVSNARHNPSTNRSYVRIGFWVDTELLVLFIFIFIFISFFNGRTYDDGLAELVVCFCFGI